MTWLDEPDDDEVEETALTARQERGLAKERIKRLEDEVFEEAAWVCQQAMRFGDIPFGTEDPPAQWVKEHGEEEARRILRYVQAAQMSARDAPAGIKVATTVLTGLLRARAEKKAAQPLNVNVVTLTTGDAKVYPTQVIDEG